MGALGDRSGPGRSEGRGRIIIQANPLYTNRCLRRNIFFIILNVLVMKLGVNSFKFAVACVRITGVLCNRIDS